MSDDAKTHTLVIHLARPNATRFADLVDPAGRNTPYAIQINGSHLAELYIESSPPKTPDWAVFFDGYVDVQEFGKNRSTSAALLVEVRGTFFALTFGHGRFILNQDCWEDRFGLKVALNCIGEGKVRSMNKHSLDQLLRHSQEQASRDASPREFGFDIEQDLLMAVTGTPSEARFGSRLSGAESLHVSVSVQLNSLPEFLGDIKDKFLDTSYKRNFPWVDHIAEVTNVTVERELNALLVSRISAGKTDQIWMAVPELIAWDKVRGFRYPTLRSSPEYKDVHLEDFVASLREQAVTVDLLAKRKVVAVDANGRPRYKWSAYDCLYAELETARRESFVLSGGKWYQIETNFVNDVNAAYQGIPEFEEDLPEFHHESEGEYLKDVSQSDTGTYALMDQQLISYGGGQSKIEFCDLLTASHDVLHVKRYGQASALSHLFAQGVVSGELFQTDATFRNAVNSKLPVAFRLGNAAERPKFELFRVVFAIISDRPGPLTIPFFSRLNLKHAAKRLEGYGYRVAKAKIAVEEQFAKLQRLRPRSRAVK